MSTTPRVFGTALIPSKSTSLASYLTTMHQFPFIKLLNKVINACLKGVLYR